MSELLDASLRSFERSPIVFAKFLAANDTGLTGGHQCGIYIPKNSVSLIFEKPFEKGENHSRPAVICWNENEFCTKSSFIYYGKAKNEYRITRFGRGFSLLQPDHTGDLLIICKENDQLYKAYVLSTEDDIENFLLSTSCSPTSLNRLIKVENKEKTSFDEIIDSYVIEFGDKFPDGSIMSLTAEEVDGVLNGDPLDFTPDELILRWVDTEYKLFRRIEEHVYEWVTCEPAKSFDAFVQTGLEIANRRKSRAGKSLERHLASVFDLYEIPYTPQAKTELKKHPDFIFPSEAAYHDSNYPADKLMFLGSKTTCKDRWRQVLNEADRIQKKYLFTLQQGISADQLKEMHAENLVLVVPEEYHKAFPKTDFESVISLEEFIARVKKTIS